MSTISILDLPGLRAREALEPGFVAGLQAVADRLGLEASYIGAVMSLESGFNPQARNPHGNATGLIQFMPATAKLLGTSADALFAMTAIEQLPFVEAYYRKTGKAIRKEVPGDYYMATFLPAYVGRDSSFVLATPGDPVYDQNKGLDVNADGSLTVGDVTNKIDARVAQASALPRLVVTVNDAPVTPPPKAPGAPADPVHLPSPRSSWPASALPSFGQLSESVGAVVSFDKATEARECTVFAASVELAEVEANAWTTERLRVYWRSALGLPDGAHVDGYLHLDWCGVFALWALHEGGAAEGTKWIIGRGFIDPAGLHITKTPKPGDVAYKAAPFQHHAIVIAVEGDDVHTIDGNQGQTPIKTHTSKLTDWTAFYSVDPLLPTNPPEAA